ncbi:YoaK family protein [Kaistia dalseonensis]|uniref:Uncharacterized membrane protein YoaK (UPF0700 family) n=1 Tax=Kaistia dalseonensis TaxID=410840 RepID=A0ABU0H7A4_9HYPH|nr:YoaK family protein [Kaistia dalseonensis]MCX5495595.1 YoaK family protein [Kaistia dalseonensis]MDQ0438187.1 uncharacterized membrane protein YoaK (UPF0700 family) [Kaistia dalseonensis]
MTANIPLQIPVAADLKAPTASAPLPSTAPQGGSAARYPFAFALTLTGLAGFLDAAAYVRFNHLYVSFMSGNSTHLGISVADWAVPDLVAVLGVISAFVAGSAVGTWVADHFGARLIVRVLALEAGLFAAAILASLASLSLFCVMIVALTMGIQNVLHQAVGGVDVGKGFVTGMLFRFGQSIARISEAKVTWPNASTSLLNWLAFVGGAALGAVAIRLLDFTACLVIGFCLIVAMLVVVPLRHR